MKPSLSKLGEFSVVQCNLVGIRGQDSEIVRATMP